jgi:hypothetical protein
MATLISGHAVPPVPQLALPWVPVGVELVQEAAGDTTAASQSATLLSIWADRKGPANMVLWEQHDVHHTTSSMFDKCSGQTIHPCAVMVSGGQTTAGCRHACGKYIYMLRVRRTTWHAAARNSHKL